MNVVIVNSLNSYLYSPNISADSPDFTMKPALNQERLSPAYVT